MASASDDEKTERDDGDEVSSDTPDKDDSPARSKKPKASKARETKASKASRDSKASKKPEPAKPQASTEKTAWWRYVIPVVFVLTGLAAGGLGFLTSKETATEWFRETGFYSIFASFFLWLSLAPIGRVTRDRVIAIWKEHWLAITLSLAIAVGSFLVSPPLFRILADETNLVGVAMQMFDDHGFMNPTEGVYYWSGMKQLLGYEWDKRPLLYPFLIYLTHSAFGYRPDINGFLVNGICTFGLYVAFYILLKRFFPKFYAIVGTCFLAAFPLNVLWTTSCGFEIPNLFFGVLAFLAFDSFIRERDGKTASYLLATLLVVSQVRYESALFALVMMAWIPFLLPRAKWTELDIRVIPIPILYLAVVWQRRIHTGQGIFQMPGDKPPFAFEYIKGNLDHAFNFFTAEKEHYGTIPILFWAGVLGLLLTIYWLVRNRKDVGLRRWSHIINATVIVLAHAGILFTYYWGNLTLQYAIRLGIIFLPFLVVLALVAVREIVKEHEGLKRFTVVGVIALFAYYWPTASQNGAAIQIFIHREFRVVREFLDREYPDNDVLLITPLSNLYVPFRISAVRNGRANADPAGLLTRLDRGQTQEVLGIQYVSYSTGQPDPNTHLAEGFVTETIYESQYNGAKALRIVRITPSPDLNLRPQRPRLPVDRLNKARQLENGAENKRE